MMSIWQRLIGRCRKVVACFLFAAVCLSAAPSPSKADVTWLLTNIPLDDGAFLNGTFFINQYGILSNWNVTSTPGSSGVGAYTYTPVINANQGGDTVVIFNRNDPPYFGALQLTFANSLTTPGIDPIVGGSGGPSWECLGWSCPESPIRFVAEGSFASAVPELKVWAMLLLGFAGLGFIAFRRTRSDAVARTA